MPEDQKTMHSEEDVYEALEEVIDTELGLDFVSLGLVYEVELEEPDVYVTFTLTTPACPMKDKIRGDIEAAIAAKAAERGARSPRR